MSELKVNSIKGTGASTAAITIDSSSGGCTANITNKPNRNLIINGAMNVAQRGTSFSAVQNTFTLDRFKFKRESTAANFTMAQSTTSPDGFSKSLKMTCTAADTSTASNEFVMVRYNIEAQDLQSLGYGTTSAKPLVLSFYVRSSLTGVYGVNCLQIDNSNKIYSRTYTINSADTWERKTISIPADTSGVINDDNGVGLQINFALVIGSAYKGSAVSSAWETYANDKFASQHGVNFASSTSNDWYLTGVQLEVDHTGSSVATDFEHRSFAQELALCQRYCVQWNPSNTFGMGQVYSGQGYVQLPLAVPCNMRTKPSVSKNGSWFQSGLGNSTTEGDRGVSVEGLNATNKSAFTQRIFVHNNASNQGNGTTVWCTVPNNSGVYCRLDAEL